MWIEQGSAYNVAFGQCIYYETQESELDDIVILITIGTRFARSNIPISDDNRLSLKKIIARFYQLDLKQFDLSEYEMEVLAEEVREVAGYIQEKI